MGVSDKLEVEKVIEARAASAAQNIESAQAKPPNQMFRKSDSQKNPEKPGKPEKSKKA
jgi:hypothetical protein